MQVIGRPGEMNVKDEFAGRKNGVLRPENFVKGRFVNQWFLAIKPARYFKK